MNEHGVYGSEYREPVDFQPYEDDFYDQDSQLIRGILSEIIKLQKQIDDGQEIDPTRLDKIVDKANMTKLLMEPIVVSGKLRLFDKSFDDAAYIPKEL